MSERRTEKITTTLEPTVYHALETAIEASRSDDNYIISQSSYIRMLIIKDLRSTGLLTDGMIERLAM